MNLNVRYVDTDLNRSFGKRTPCGYEKNRAVLLTKVMSQKDFVIDIHQTTADMDHCGFITSNTPQIWQMCSYFHNLKHIVLAKGYGGKDKNLLLENDNMGVAIEYSRTGNFEQECQIVEQDIQNFINKVPNPNKQKYYQLITKIEKTPEFSLTNWVVITDEQKQKLALDITKDLYPIFIGEKAYGTQYCTIVEKINT